MHLLLALLPLIAFYLAEQAWGLSAAVVASLVAAIPSLAWTWRTQGRLDRMTLGALALAIVLGGASVASDDPRFVLWSPVVGNLVLVAIVGGLDLAGRDPVVGALHEADPTLALSDEEAGWLRAVGRRFVGVLVAQAALFAWATTQPRETWLAVTGLGGWIVLGAWVAAEALWARFGPAPPREPDDDRGA